MGYGQLDGAGFTGREIYGGGAGRLGLSHLVGAFYVDAYGVVFQPRRASLRGLPRLAASP